MSVVKRRAIGVVIPFLVGLAVPILLGAGGTVTDPNGVAPDRYVYYPGTETLSPGEIRIVACGTGMPDQRLSQASACFLFEFGNGDKLIFDLGTGSMENLAAYMIPYEYLDKIILSHLHTDHMGALPALWAGGWTAGRPGGAESLGALRPASGTGYQGGYGRFP